MTENDLIDGDEYRLFFGDAIEYMPTWPAACIDHAVFSPPFPAVYAYGSELADIGNSEDIKTEAKLHLSFFFKSLRRIMKPGRVVLCHCQQIVKLKRSGGQGIHDFRGLLIRIAERAGFIFDYDWCVRKNPQAQALTTKSRQLQFAGLESDRAQSRGALLDYLIKFTAPGDNAIPINNSGEVTRNEHWVKWAEGCWSDIDQFDTLNVEEARGKDDTKHICPLQLEIYRRSIMMYSLPGEIVFDPFAGLGSCGFMALGGSSPKTGNRLPGDTRRFVGCELKPEYFVAAHNNLERALCQRVDRQKTLFDSLVDATP